MKASIRQAKDALHHHAERDRKTENGKRQRILPVGRADEERAARQFVEDSADPGLAMLQAPAEPLLSP